MKRGRWCSNWTRRCCTDGRRSTGPGSQSGLVWRCCSGLCVPLADGLPAVTFLPWLACTLGLNDARIRRVVGGCVGSQSGSGSPLSKPLKEKPRFFVRLVLWMIAIGAGRSAVLAQQHGEQDYQAMVVALVVCFILLALRPRRRRLG